MSYSCFISFKKLECDEICLFFQKLKATAIKRVCQIAADEYHYCPLCIDQLHLSDNYMEITKEKKEASRNWAINCVFMFRYFYNKELKLLGIYGVTNKLRDLFDATVHFQNSCDQNYDRTNWEGVKLFEEMYDCWMAYPKEHIINQYEKRNGDGSWEDHGNYEEKWLDYYRKDMCYDEIWTLFESTFYNHDETLYFGVFGPSDVTEIGEFIIECYKNHKEWEKTLDKV